MNPFISEAKCDKPLNSYKNLKKTSGRPREFDIWLIAIKVLCSTGNHNENFNSLFYFCEATFDRVKQTAYRGYMVTSWWPSEVAFTRDLLEPYGTDWNSLELSKVYRRDTRDSSS